MKLKPKMHEFSVLRGDSFRATLLVSVNFALTGKVGTLQVDSAIGQPVLTFRTTDATMTVGDVVTRTVDGVETDFREVALFQPASATSAAATGCHRYELKFTDSTDTTTLLRGVFRIDE